MTRIQANGSGRHPLASVMVRRIAWLTLVLFWLVVLPRLEQCAPMAQHIAWLEAARIDPSAMFYSEMPIVLEMARRRETKPFGRLHRRTPQRSNLPEE